MVERRFVPLALHLCFAFLAAARLLVTAQASVIVDTFDPGGGFSSSSADLAAYVLRVPDSHFASAESPGRANILFSSRSAAKFTVAAGSYSLSSITMPIGVNRSVPTAAVLRVRFTADAGGVPGTTLETLSASQDIWPPVEGPFATTTTLLSTAHPALVGGNSYWIVTEPTPQPLGPNTYVEYYWFWNTSGTTVPVITQDSEFQVPADPWPTTSTNAQRAFRVEGAATTGVENPADGQLGLALGVPRPNPSAAGTHLGFRLGHAATVTGELYDVNGRLVRSLLERRPFPAGQHELDWDGRDASGQRVATGIYVMRVSTDESSKARRIVVVR